MRYPFSNRISGIYSSDRWLKQKDFPKALKSRIFAGIKINVRTLHYDEKEN
jgi:hypothetical protein